MQTTPTTAKPDTDKSQFTFVPFGETDEIALSFAIIRKNFCFPTAKGHPPTDQDVLAFAITCKSQKLNPFLGDGWLVGYDASTGPKFSVLVSQKVLLKRAEVHPMFDGLESGITILTKEGQLENRNTEIVLDGQDLIGAWCRVYRKDRSKPIYKQIAIGGMRKKSSFWDSNPAGQIVKCAESDCLRFAFPTVTGGLLTQEERPLIDIGAVSAQMQPMQAQPAQIGQEPAPANGGEPEKAGTIQDQLADIVTGAGYTFDEFAKVAFELGWITEPEKWASFSDIDEKNASRFVNAKKGLLQGLKQVRVG